MGDDSGTIYAVGNTASNNFPVKDAIQGTLTSSKAGFITIISPFNLPSASFTADPLAGEAPLEVQFNDTSTGSPTSWSWAFGDGGTSDEQNPFYTYTSAGLYTVNLTVTNTDGSDSEEKADYINVTEPAGPSGPAPLPSNRHIFINVANDAGIKYDLDGAVYGEGNNGTYYIKADSGGMNEIHVTTDTGTASGQVTESVTHTTAPSGTFFVTNTGSAGISDDLVLLLAVNGTIPEDFSLTIRSSGYIWTPNSTVDGLPDDYAHSDGVIEETFTKADLYLRAPDLETRSGCPGYPAVHAALLRAGPG